MIRSDDQTLLDHAAHGDVRLIGLTVKQYDFMIERGLLAENASTELINGFIVRKDRSAVGGDSMTIGDRHRIAILRLGKLDPIFEQHGCFIQAQQPVWIPPKSEPEPDLAVVGGTIEDYVDRKPGVKDILSIIEVADSSMKYDLGAKLKIYARGGIAEYIVINLVDNIVLVHHDPARGKYRSLQTLRAGETLAIRSVKNRVVEIPVAKLL